jgi:hypothetical protein
MRADKSVRPQIAEDATFFFRQPKSVVLHLLIQVHLGGSLWLTLCESPLTN